MSRARTGRVQRRVIGLMAAGYRLAVRRYERTVLGMDFVCRSCLLYATDLTRQPPYVRLRWSTVSRLVERGVVERVRAIGGNEEYFALAPAWLSEREVREEERAGG